MDLNFLEDDSFKFKEENLLDNSFIFEKGFDSFFNYNPYLFSNEKDSLDIFKENSLDELMANEERENNKRDELKPNDANSNIFDENKNEIIKPSRDNKEIKKGNLNQNNEVNNFIEKNKTGKNLFNVYIKKEHTKYSRDNIIDKIKRNSISNIFSLDVSEIKKINNYNISLFKNQVFRKITSALIFLQKLKFEELLKLKTRDIFYTEEILEKIKLKNKNVTEKYVQKKKDNNKNNKLLITKIEELKEKIDEIKDENIKKSILKLNEIINKPVYDMYKIYITNDNRYENFNTLMDDIISLEKNGEDGKYLEKYENIAKSLIKNIDESTLR